MTLPDYKAATNAVIAFYNYYNVKFSPEFIQLALNLLSHRDFYYEQLMGEKSHMEHLYSIATKMGFHSVDDDEMEVCSLARIIEIVYSFDVETIEAIKEARIVSGITGLLEFAPKVHKFESATEAEIAFRWEEAQIESAKEARNDLLLFYEQNGLNMFGLPIDEGAQVR